ncbi:hypothetical protein FOCC_FOCC000051 [Frankliniella occidentalis]|nr:hypothetical protein FOCC_FOCC000051 [Frankliniella occidentalis]
MASRRHGNRWTNEEARDGGGACCGSTNTTDSSGQLIYQQQFLNEFGISLWCRYFMSPETGRGQAGIGFRRSALSLHPDRARLRTPVLLAPVEGLPAEGARGDAKDAAGGSAEDDRRFALAARAYEVLVDPKSRALYEVHGDASLPPFHGDAQRTFRKFFGTDNPFLAQLRDRVHFDVEKPEPPETIVASLRVTLNEAQHNNCLSMWNRPGFEKRLAGEGLPVCGSQGPHGPRGEPRGDLVLRLDVRFPAALSRPCRALLDQALQLDEQGEARPRAQQPPARQPGGVARAILEDKMRRQTKVDGGVSRNDFVCQLLADLSGMAVERCTTSEMSAMGAAYLAGVAAGVWRGQEEVAALRDARVERVFSPAATRDASLALWERAVGRFLDWYSPDDGPATASAPAPAAGAVGVLEGRGAGGQGDSAASSGVSSAATSPVASPSGDNQAVRKTAGN